MAIKLIEFPSPDGMSEHVCVSVEDFADDQQVKMVLDEACAILTKVPGAAREWRRESDCCYRVTGGILRKNGGRKALDKGFVVRPRDDGQGWAVDVFDGRRAWSKTHLGEQPLNKAEAHRLAHKLRDPKFYSVRTKRAVNSLTVERGPKGGAA